MEAAEPRREPEPPGLSHPAASLGPGAAGPRRYQLRGAARGSSAGRAAGGGAGSSPEGRWSWGASPAVSGAAGTSEGHLPGQRVPRERAGRRRALPRALFFPFPPRPEGAKAAAAPLSGPGRPGGGRPAEGPSRGGSRPPDGRSVPPPAGHGAWRARPGRCRQMGLRRGDERGSSAARGGRQVSRCALMDLWGP